MGLARRKVKKISWGPGSHFQDERCSCRRPTNGCSWIRLLLLLPPVSSALQVPREAPTYNTASHGRVEDVGRNTQQGSRVGWKLPKDKVLDRVVDTCSAIDKVLKPATQQVPGYSEARDTTGTQIVVTYCVDWQTESINDCIDRCTTLIDLLQ